MDSKSQEKPLFSKTGSQDDSFYDTIETTSPEYDNAVNQSQVDPVEQERLEQEWKDELAKLEQEIMTLRSVLGAKQSQAASLKRKLGITPMTEFKDDMKHGMQNVRESTAYVKTGAAFKTFGAVVSKKMGDLRNSNAFKSVEEKVGGAYTSVKTKVSTSKSENNFEEVLNNTAENQAAQDMENTNSASANSTPLPEEKVPL